MGGVALRGSFGVDSGATRCGLPLLASVIAESQEPTAHSYVDFAAAVEFARAMFAEAPSRAGIAANYTTEVKLGLGVGRCAPPERSA